MFLLQSVNANDKVIIIADTRHTQRWSERKVDPTLCKGNLAFFCISPTTLEILRLWAHERTLRVPRNVDDLETIDFAEKLGTIAEDQHLTRCVQACLAGAEVIKLNSTIRERLTKSSETKTWKTEETPWQKLIEKLICLNKHHCLSPESQKERLASWLRLPRRARVAIRRLHRNLRHLPKEALVQMLRAARAPQDCISAAKVFRC